MSGEKTTRNGRKYQFLSKNTALLRGAVRQKRSNHAENIFSHERGFHIEPYILECRTGLTCFRLQCKIEGLVAVAHERALDEFQFCDLYGSSLHVIGMNVVHSVALGAHP